MYLRSGSATVKDVLEKIKKDSYCTVYVAEGRGVPIKTRNKNVSSFKELKKELKENHNVVVVDTAFSRKGCYIELRKC